MKLNKDFKYAIRDLFWLLNRKYPKPSSVELVGNRYRLNSDERNILYRGVFDRESCIERREKIVKDIKSNSILIIDGLNILITIVSYLKGRVVFKAMDGFVRDIAGVFGNFTYDSYAEEAANVLLQWIFSVRSSLSGIYVFFDYSASRSGELASYIRNKLFGLFLKSEVIVNKKCDGFIIEKAKDNINNSIVVTSDTAIIDKVWVVAEPFSYIFNKIFKKKITDLKRISGIRF